MEKKILFVCRANVTRSPMASIIFDAKMKQLGLEGLCSSDSAGQRRARQDTSHFIDTALTRAGYKPLKNHQPKQIRSQMVENADLVLMINLEIYNVFTKAWENRPELLNKLRVLPHYGLSEEKKQNDIFDPRYVLVSPEDEHSKFDPASKMFARELSHMRNAFGRWAVDRFTPYLVFTDSQGYSEKITALYKRTIAELEPCIDGAIARMKQEGFLS